MKSKFDLSTICPKLQFTHFVARIISYLKTHLISYWHLLSGHCPISIPKSSILDATIWLGNQIVVPLTLRVKCSEYLFRRSIPSFAISPVGASKKIRLKVGWLEVTRSVLVGWWWGQQCLGERLIEVAPECRLVSNVLKNIPKYGFFVTLNIQYIFYVYRMCNKEMLLTISLLLRY